MKKALLALILLAGAVLTGCGMVDSYAEREQRYKNITRLQMRQAVDDWDYIWMYERNNHMTQWHPRVGY